MRWPKDTGSIGNTPIEGIFFSNNLLIHFQTRGRDVDEKWCWAFSYKNGMGSDYHEITVHGICMGIALVIICSIFFGSDKMIGYCAGAGDYLSPVDDSVCTAVGI